LREERDERFWATVALVVASKGVELDRRVPYLTRYQRHADKSFTLQDDEHAERRLLETLGFDIQFSTFVSFIHFYLTNGIVFRSDAVHSSSLRFIEDEVLGRVKELIKTGEFLHHHPEKLALGIIREVRIKFRLEPWVRQLEEVSGFETEQILFSEKHNVLKPFNGIFKKLSANEETTHGLQISMSLTEEKLKARRGVGTDNTLRLHNIKENSVKMLHQHAPLTIFRTNITSANKSNDNHMRVGSEKGVTLNTNAKRI
jgi:hypothetical protein